MITFHVQENSKAPDLKLTALAKKIAPCLKEHLKLPTCEAALVLTSNAESRSLNKMWRGKDKPTNVLSFPQMNDREIKTFLKSRKKSEAVYLGDIVLCLPVLRAEAKAQKKLLKNHVIHLIVHGTLHLLGYDHINNREADTMEKLETAILAKLRIPDPYEDREPVPNRKKIKKTGSRTVRKKK